MPTDQKHGADSTAKECNALNATLEYKPTSAALFVGLSMLTGLMGAFIYPVMSYFLVEGLNVAPMYIGLYMVAVTLSGLAMSQRLGALADKGFCPRKLYALANTGIIVALCVYINVNSFIFILIAGVCFMAMGNASTPQVLTLSRQWANQLSKPNTLNINTFNAQIRAGISFSWMIGPPLAFMLLAIVGFSGVFSLAIIVALVGIIFVWRFIPLHGCAPKNTHDEKAPPTPKAFWYLTVAIVLGSMGNNIYTSALPLYTIKELGLPSYSPGLLMGLVAGMEIPIMLVTSRLCDKFKKSSLMIAAFIFGVIFYGCIFSANTLWQFALLQVINAVFYGLFASVGLILIQEQLPQRIGFTSAVYSNGFKIGVMMGASCTGIIAQFLSFQHAMLGAMAAAGLAVIFMMMFRLSISAHTRLSMQ